MTQPTPIQLNNGDCAFIWRKDGSIEMHLPDLDEDDEIEAGSPVFWCSAVGLVFSSGDQEVLDALAKGLLEAQEGDA